MEELYRYLVKQQAERLQALKDGKNGAWNKLQLIECWVHSTDRDEQNFMNACIALAKGLGLEGQVIEKDYDFCSETGKEFPVFRFMFNPDENTLEEYSKIPERGPKIMRIDGQYGYMSGERFVVVGY